MAMELWFGDFQTNVCKEDIKYIISMQFREDFGFPLADLTEQFEVL